MAKRFFGNHFLRSVFTHLFFAGLIVFQLSDTSPQVKGGAGLSGKTATHFDMTVSEPVASKKALEKKIEKAPPPIREGLPTEVKRPEPRIIDDVPKLEKKELRSAGTTDNLNTGVQGQAGTSLAPSASVGNSNQSNLDGIYLQKLYQKIQENLESAGYIEFDRKTLLQFLIRKNGVIDSIEILKSSGDPMLDKKAVLSVKKVGTFLERPNDLRVQVPVHFRATR